MDPLQQALALHRAGQLEHADAAYRQLLAAEPNNARAVYLLGLTLAQRGRAQDAAQCWAAAVRIKPDYAEAHANLGAGLAQLNQPELAMVHLRRAIELDPRSAAAHNNLASLLFEQSQTDQAVEHYRRAIELKPDYFDALFNLAKVLQRTGDVTSAQPVLDRAVALKPADPEARFLRGMNLLLQGEFTNGLKDYEARVRCKDFVVDPRALPEPAWEGQDIAGRTILLHAEQGFGDTIQFARYVPLVARRGAQVIFECQSPLVPLMRSVGGVERLIARGDPLPGFDFHASLLSLPRIFGTTAETIPNAVPYLAADPERLNVWKGKVEDVPRGHKRVGVCWAGNPRHTNDRNRSMPADALQPLLRVADVTWFSLQKDRPSPLAGLIDFTADLRDFADTAALVSQLDLVISVDTVIAHLAGALARPTWVLLPFAPEWRWQIKRPDSPWYPTARLFRQPCAGDWAAVVRDVVVSMRDLTGSQ